VTLPPGPPQAGDVTRTNRVAGHQDDGDGRGDTPDGTDRYVTENDQDIRSKLHQLTGKLGKAIDPGLPEAVLDDDVLARDVSEFL
jgi:hypothetical protein